MKSEKITALFTVLVMMFTLFSDLAAADYKSDENGGIIWTFETPETAATLGEKNTTTYYVYDTDLSEAYNSKTEAKENANENSLIIYNKNGNNVLNKIGGGSIYTRYSNNVKLYYTPSKDGTVYVYEGDDIVREIVCSAEKECEIQASANYTKIKKIVYIPGEKVEETPTPVPTPTEKPFEPNLVYEQDFSDGSETVTGWNTYDYASIKDSSEAPEGANQIVSGYALNAFAAGTGNRRAYVDITDEKLTENDVLQTQAIFEFDFYLKSGANTCTVLTMGYNQENSYNDFTNTFFALGNGDGVGARNKLRYYNYEMNEWSTIDNGNAVWLHLKLYVDFETRKHRFIISDTDGKILKESDSVSFEKGMAKDEESGFNRMILSGFRTGNGGVSVNTWIDNFKVYKMEESEVEYVNYEKQSAVRIGEMSPVSLKNGDETIVIPNMNYDDVELSLENSDESVVSAEIDGGKIKLSALKNGYADITLTAAHGEETAKKTLYVTVSDKCENVTADSQKLIENRSVVTSVIMDAEYEDDNHGYEQLKRAVGDLRQDFAIVSGGMLVEEIPIDDTTEKKNERIENLDDNKILRVSNNGNGEKTAIIIGSMQSSEIIKSIIMSGKLDEAAKIRGEWEGYVIKKVNNPIDGIDAAVVIAGTDIRGTVYGIYDLSEYIGISPWYWWSDVPVKTRSDLSYNRETIVQKGADVKYRGIFINDEEQLVNWCETHFPDDGVNGPNEYIYRHMFEVLLRLGANTLWPAMHESTTAFNTVTDKDGISVNAKAADEYGIIMSSSHCEIMLRSNVEEWGAWYNENKIKYNINGSTSAKAYDYTINKDAILAYWRERVEANKEFENIYVLGIRGVHDGAPVMTNLEGAGYGSGTEGIVKMQMDVISEQRKIIKDVYGSEDGAAQVFIPYKEMNTYYNYNGGELADWLPDDIMIMYAEDNQGYLRQITTADERERNGGTGVYYHNSYWGTPKSYLWLNSMPVSLMYEEMKKAYDTGSDKYWILNVGDLKPGELKAEIFLDMAWDINKYTAANIKDEYYKKQGMRDYALSETDAEIYAEQMMKISKYEQTKRAEFFGYESKGSAEIADFSGTRSYNFSLTQHGDEAQRRVDDWTKVTDILGKIYDNLAPEYKDAFYEQVYFSALQNKNVTEEYVYYLKNNLYAKQGRYNDAKRYAELSKSAVRKLSEDQIYFYELNNGKWKNVINYEHIIGYQTNQGILLVTEDMYIDAELSEGIGAVCEGQELPDDDVTLLFDYDADNERFIDIYAKGISEVEWYAKTSADWINLSADEGTVYTSERIQVKIDYDKAENGENNGEIYIYNKANGSVVNTFKVKAVKNIVKYEDNVYIEANGYVAIEAEHYTKIKEGNDGSTWVLVDNLGNVGGSMKGYPDLAQKVTEDYQNNSAKLIYRVYFKNTGNFSGVFYRLPTLNEGSENDIARTNRTAIGLDGGTPVVLGGNTTTSNSTVWGNNVMRGYEPLLFNIEVTEPGYHDIVVYKIDSSICFDRIVINTGASVADNSLIGPPESPKITYLTDDFADKVKIETGENKLTITAQNGYKLDKLMLYTAIYGSDNTLKNVSVTKFIAENDVIVIPVTKQNLDEGETCKLMLWNENQEPIIPAVKSGTGIFIYD